LDKFQRGFQKKAWTGLLAVQIPTGMTWNGLMVRLFDKNPTYTTDDALANFATPPMSHDPCS
jgi:hypothetical protein